MIFPPLKVTNSSTIPCFLIQNCGSIPQSRIINPKNPLIITILTSLHPFVVFNLQKGMNTMSQMKHYKYPHSLEFNNYQTRKLTIEQVKHLTWLIFMRIILSLVFGLSCLTPIKLFLEIVTSSISSTTKIHFFKNNQANLDLIKLCTIAAVIIYKPLTIIAIFISRNLNQMLTCFLQMEEKEQPLFYRQIIIITTIITIWLLIKGFKCNRWRN